MQVLKSQMCISCRTKRQNPGSESIEEVLDKDWYKAGIGNDDINTAMMVYLQKNGGCPSCINLFKRAAGQA
jgi:hypothetical protein